MPESNAISSFVYDDVRAYGKLEHGTIDAASKYLMDSNINRSPSSYLLNPQSERDEYADQGDTDKIMLILKFFSDNKKPLGALNWFAVHGTSMNNTNLVGLMGVLLFDFVFLFVQPDNLVCLFVFDSCFQGITKDMLLI